MIFTETNLKGAFVVEPELLKDERGFFSRIWCRREFLAHIGTAEPVQCNISFSKHKGTLRGMHYQATPNEEAKLVRCTMGAIYDVIIDLRPDSSTFKQWISVEMTSENRKMIYIPEHFANGFITLEDNTEVFYQMTEFYAPDSVRGVRWNDPAFNIQWPIEIVTLSERDQNFPDFTV